MEKIKCRSSNCCFLKEQNNDWGVALNCYLYNLFKQWAMTLVFCKYISEPLAIT